MSIIKKDMKTTYENNHLVFVSVNMAIASYYLTQSYYSEAYFDVKTEHAHICMVIDC